MKKITAIIVMLGFGALAMAMGSFAKTLTEAYNLPADSKVVKAGCMACHKTAKGGALNPYGKDLKTAMGGAHKLTVANIKSIDGKDSDGDGKTNGAEIKAGSMPGGS